MWLQWLAQLFPLAVRLRAAQEHRCSVLPSLWVCGMGKHCKCPL